MTNSLVQAVSVYRPASPLHHIIIEACVDIYHHSLFLPVNYDMACVDVFIDFEYIFRFQKGGKMQVFAVHRGKRALFKGYQGSQVFCISANSIASASFLSQQRLHSSIAHNSSMAKEYTQLQAEFLAIKSRMVPVLEQHGDVEVASKDIDQVRLLPLYMYNILYDNMYIQCTCTCMIQKIKCILICMYIQ